LLQIVQVDAFADRPFAGNPAAVLVLPVGELLRWEDLAWLQDVAAEMNLSETAFLRRRKDGGFDLRWFTPTVEVELCGHATLASAHVLWTEGHLPVGETARFHTLSGVLTAATSADSSGRRWIDLDFPAEPAAEAAPPPGLLEALRVRSARFVGRSRFDYLVEVAEEAEVRELRPDLGRLGEIQTRGVIVTAGASGYDFVSRFFAPAAGVAEDPVTGSAHCSLGPHWQARLGRGDLVGYQASARGGVVRVRCRGNRVLLGGQAVTVLRGELAVAFHPGPLAE
jgi:predicted PhzF superfamily epimerase YddE/YHI9